MIKTAKIATETLNEKEAKIKADSQTKRHRGKQADSHTEVTRKFNKNSCYKTFSVNDHVFDVEAPLTRLNPLC